MNMLSRKQREIEQRHTLILETAKTLFALHGYHSVTMDMIAKEMEYSKGTIYQHFGCKESIITHLCIDFYSLIHDLLETVVEDKQLNPRLQMLLVQEIFILLNNFCQADVQLKNLAAAEPFCVKVPEDLTETSNELEVSIFQSVVEIVVRAVEEKQLVLNIPLTPVDVALGCWSMVNGTFMIIDAKSCAATLELPRADHLLRKNSHFYLEGIGWKSFSLTSKMREQIAEHLESFYNIIEQYDPACMSSKPSGIPELLTEFPLNTHSDDQIDLEKCS